MRTCGRILFVSTISASGFFCFFFKGMLECCSTGRQIKGGRNRDRESKSENKATSSYTHSLPESHSLTHAHTYTQKRTESERSCLLSLPLTLSQRLGQPPCTDCVYIQREDKDREARQGWKGAERQRVREHIKHMAAMKRYHQEQNILKQIL